jgi:hypothetical protein
MTEKNLSEFVRSIENRRIELAEIVKDFRRALSTVVPWEFFRLFTPSEICHAITGESYKISRVDLSSRQRRDMDMDLGHRKCTGLLI